MAPAKWWPALPAPAWPPLSNPGFARDGVRHTPCDALELRHGWLVRLRWRDRPVPLDASTNGCNKKESQKFVLRLGCTSLEESFESIVHALYVPVQQRLRGSSPVYYCGLPARSSSFVWASAVSLSRVSSTEHRSFVSGLRSN